MKEEKIEKCPCCGGTASIGTLKISSPSPIRDKNGSPRTESYFVNCQHCQMNNNGIVHGYTTETEAVDAWNARAESALNQSALTARVEELEKENRKLREVMTIYSREENWDKVDWIDDFRIVFNWTEKHGYSLAASVLEEIEKENI